MPRELAARRVAAPLGRPRDSTPNYEAFAEATVEAAAAVAATAALLSQSPHLHAQGELHPFAQSSSISPPLRFSPLARVILDAV